MAYVIKSNKRSVVLPYLPKAGKLKKGRDIVLDTSRQSDEEELFSIMRYIVEEEGTSYPQDEMSTIEDFRAYYFTHEVYVCRDSTTKEVLGAFYVKPNFPGRCSHICNGGFIVKKEARGQGVGFFLGSNYIQIARDLGYRASFFNLVFINNTVSVKLWRSLGFKEIGIIPQAGYLKGVGYTDAIQFYYDLLTVSKTPGIE